MTGGVPFVLSNNAGTSRTTVPSIPMDLSYSVNAKNGTKNVQAVVTGRSFSIRLTSGTWTLTAKGISNGKKILEGSSVRPLQAEKERWLFPFPYRNMKLQATWEVLP